MISGDFSCFYACHVCSAVAFTDYFPALLLACFRLTEPLPPFPHFESALACERRSTYSAGWIRARVTEECTSVGHSILVGNGRGHLTTQADIATGCSYHDIPIPIASDNGRGLLTTQADIATSAARRKQKME
jgi:hypothetical protein